MGRVRRNVEEPRIVGVGPLPDEVGGLVRDEVRRVLPDDLLAALNVEPGVVVVEVRDRVTIEERRFAVEGPRVEVLTEDPGPVPGALQVVGERRPLIETLDCVTGVRGYVMVVCVPPVKIEPRRRTAQGSRDERVRELGARRRRTRPRPLASRRAFRVRWSSTTMIRMFGRSPTREDRATCVCPDVRGSDAAEGHQSRDQLRSHRLAHRLVPSVMCLGGYPTQEGASTRPKRSVVSMGLVTRSCAPSPMARARAIRGTCRP